ncbi:hypothetical protein LQ318_12310 [Aliifodinibius salicampi]|uniref:Uncharacterized protein n=1 Tax=Fodinibius salicampi TaxID=1920655 RepID=A0ABT3Q0V7_9BACT|nr:hypothetical protein [Fodinibius salicampi]MCW9713686.1 hypothetical protein [Fodinibius salicampi]
MKRKCRDISINISNGKEITSIPGFDNEFTQRNTTFMTWNLMHMAHMLDQTGGIPAHGNKSAVRVEGRLPFRSSQS